MTAYRAFHKIIVSVMVATSVYVTSAAAFGLQEKRVISVNDPRPLAAAILRLESELGQVITYEDPPYANSSDYKDVTASVSRVANPERPVLVPRGGRLNFSYRRLETLTLRAQQTGAVLRALVDMFDRSYPTGAMFDLKEVAGAYHVVPISARSRAGLVQAYDSLLDTPVTIAAGDKNALTAVQMLVSAVSVQAKRKLLVGIVPMNILYHTKVSPAASGEQARDILLAVLNATGAKMSWQIFCSAGSDASDCYLNIHNVVP